MNNWIKPSELPDGFWGECFVSIFNDGEIFTEINYVKKDSIGVYWFLDEEKEWLAFNKDESYLRLVPIIYPTITQEDFK